MRKEKVWCQEVVLLDGLLINIESSWRPFQSMKNDMFIFLQNVAFMTHKPMTHDISQVIGKELLLL